MAHRRSPSLARAASSADISTYSCGEGSKKLQIVACFLLLFASLIMIGTGMLILYILSIVFLSLIFLGAGLMGFYRLHLLDVISIEFLIVPLFLLVGGLYSFFVALFGFYATMKEDSCLVIENLLLP